MVWCMLNRHTSESERLMSDLIEAAKKDLIH